MIKETIIMKQLVCILIGLFILVTGVGFAADHDCGSHSDVKKSSPDEKNEAINDKMSKEAMFKVPGLEADMIKKMVEPLKGIEGIASVKPDMEKSELSVIFDPDKTKAEVIEKTLREINENIKLAEVKDVKAPAAGCGACPHKSSCAKAKSS